MLWLPLEVFFSGRSPRLCDWLGNRCSILLERRAIHPMHLNPLPTELAIVFTSVAPYRFPPLPPVLPDAVRFTSFVRQQWRLTASGYFDPDPISSVELSNALSHGRSYSAPHHDDLHRVAV